MNPKFPSKYLFVYRYTTEILEDARSISEHGGKKQIDEADVQFAVENAGFIFSEFLLHLVSSD